MVGESNEGSHTTVSARIPNGLILLLVGAVGVGGYSVGTVTPQKLESTSIQRCFDNAATALSIAERAADNATTALGVAGQHGEEIKDTNARITKTDDRVDELRLSVAEWKRDTYTREQGLDLIRRHESEHDAYEQRHSSLSERVERHNSDLNWLLTSHSKDRRDSPPSAHQ